MQTRKNVATHPELANLSLGSVYLVWSYHALIRGKQKRIEQVDAITVPRGTIVELESTGRLVSKVVARIPGSLRDTVYVLTPKGKGHWLVITCWTNCKNDTHRTLNRERLSA